MNIGAGGASHVCEVMTGNGSATSPAVLTAHPQQNLAEVLTILRLAGLDAMPVVEDGVVVGSVTRDGLVRGLARDDSTIAADVRCRLACHPEIRGWAVTVHDGEVVLHSDAPDPVEGRLVEQLAGTVLGVTTVGAPRTFPAAGGYITPGGGRR